MPKFFFHINDGDCARDSDGTDLADLAAAQRELLMFAGETLAGDASQSRIRKEWSFEATDETGLILFTLEIIAGASPAVSRFQEIRPSLRAN